MTFPLILPILTITLVLSIIWTFSDFQAVYSLTKGGPVNSTHVLATLSYQVGLQSGKISEGVAISLTMLPLLLILVVFQLAAASQERRRMSAVAPAVTSVRRMAGTRLVDRLFSLYLPLLLVLVFLLAPFYWMTITALKPNSELYNGAISPLMVFEPTTEHFEYLWTRTDFVVWLWNTMFVSIAATAISLFFGVPAGYALARLRFRAPTRSAWRSSPPTWSRRRCCSSRWSR